MGFIQMKYMLGVVCLLIGSFMAGMEYAQTKIETDVHDKLFHTDRALKGCELVSSTILKQIMEAEEKTTQCEQAQAAFMDALNSLGSISETAE
jgi:hypothetical protein